MARSLSPVLTHAAPFAPSPQQSGGSIDQPGPQEAAAAEIKETLRRVAERFDLDELDRVARRYARNPASGAAEALYALAVLVRAAPQVFAACEVNLDPDRLEALADRERALSVLQRAADRFVGLVRDTRQSHGDELVELLEVGLGRASRMNPAPAALSPAQATLLAYGARIETEGAHKGEIDQLPPAPRRGKDAVAVAQKKKGRPQSE